MTHFRPRILVTGGTGFIGANLVHRLVVEGFPVSVIARSTSGCSRLKSVLSAIDLATCDLRSGLELQSTIESCKPDVVFHLGSTSYNPPGTSPEEHFQVIVLGTLNLLNALANSCSTRFVFVSSAAVYGSGLDHDEQSLVKPNTILGAAKAAAEILIQTQARMKGIPCAILRLFTPYGPWESPGRLIPHTILSALEGKDVTLTSGQQSRDFIFVEDVVDALMLAALRTPLACAVYNVGSGHARTVLDVVNTVLTMMGNPVDVRVGELPTRADEIRQMSGQILRIEQDLGWKPQTSLENGIRRSINWFGEFGRRRLN